MNTLFAFLLAWSILPAPASPTDTRERLARKWLMIGFELNGKKYNEEWLERQRQNGLASVLEFQKNGACLLHIHSKGPGGRNQKKTKQNKWRLSEDETQLTIIAENEPPQTFTIVKVSNKKLILASETKEEKQIFTYKSLKD